MSIQSTNFINSEYFVFETKKLLCRLSYVGMHAWRLQTSKDGKTFDDMGAGQTLAKDFGENPYLTVENIEMTEETEGAWTLKASDGSSVFIQSLPFAMNFTSGNGEPCAQITRICQVWEETVSVFGKLLPEEKVYGTGERFNRLNQRGYEVSIFARDEWAQWKGNSYVPIPVVTSSNGYGLFLNRFERNYWDFDTRGDNTWDAIVKDDAPMDMYIFASNKMQDTLYGYSVLSGFAPEPVDWSYGTLVCRFYPEFNSIQGVLDMENAMKENDFPWEAVIIEGWDIYSKSRWGELKELADHLHENGKHLMVYQGCGMLPDQAKSDFGMKDEYAVRKAKNNSPLLEEVSSDNPADNPSDGSVHTHSYVDLTNPDAKKWWMEDIWGKLTKEIGVQGAKIDFCELVPDVEKLNFGDGRETPGAHHWYPVHYNVNMYKLFSSLPGGGVNYSRGGGIGAQRYPFIWAGDQTRDWFFLKAALRAVLSAGLSGIPFMSYDMSGYMPTMDLETDPADQVFVRGLEFTCFTANIQTHGKVTRPYDFEKPIRNLYRIYSNMHDALRPYLIEQGKISCQTGQPLMRALVLWDNKDIICQDCDNEYTLGDAFLVAPVLDMIDKRDIYLPDGEWEDIYTGTIYQGKQTLKDYCAPLAKLPLFINRNSKSKALNDVKKDIAKYIDEIKELVK